MPLSVGQVIHSRYRIDALLGKGGMGAVYRAWDANLDVPVAIKENVMATAASARQFQREAQMMARLRHIPGEGESIVEAGFRFTVTEATERAVVKLQVEPE